MFAGRTLRCERRCQLRGIVSLAGQHRIHEQPHGQSLALDDYNARFISTITRLDLKETGKVLSLATLYKTALDMNAGKPFDDFSLALLYNAMGAEFEDFLIKPYVMRIMNVKAINAVLGNVFLQQKSLLGGRKPLIGFLSSSRLLGKDY